METFPVLESLIYKNIRNTQLFLECDGMSLFKRELLQYESSLHLLNSVVETSIEATMVAQDMSILQHVHDLLRSCGPYTPTGDWATIILYNANIKLKEYDIETTGNKQTKHNAMSKTVTSPNFQIVDDVNDSMLFRNINEVVQWHAKEENMFNNIFMKNKHQRPSTRWNMDMKQFDERPQHYGFINDETVKKSVRAQRTRPSDELSFSFLKNHFRDSNKYMLSDRHEITKKNYKVSGNCANTQNDEYVEISFTNTPIVTTQTASQLDISKFYKECENNSSLVDLKKFKPTFVSTPKQIKSKLEKIQGSKKINNVKKRKFMKSYNSTVARKKGIDISLQQRSIKARIFNAINNSCTAVINSVTNIFKPKNVDHTIKNSNSKVKDNDLATCSYSFTEYMRKRDAVSDARTAPPNVEENLHVEPDSCRSCNSTEALKLKMINDTVLKDTVRKLKVGINMHGCDFKKISNIMWPHEAYMTPTMLYNLYRKLIMK
ncbi:hypothetical protein O3G_MSEX007740 [Manduca sexta]|uniref:Uncharacterized protein n=1 Tax=Manduca sexta TaxID=7130 RepID=A0A921Z857_MANSE|nr:hypothetical protein O3G_MSEX007740 [Manduca sexta]